MNQSLHVLTLKPKKSESNLSIYNLIAMNHKVKFIGFVPDKNDYKITVTGDYFDLIDFTESLVNKAGANILLFNLSIQENTGTYNLSINTTTHDVVNSISSPLIGIDHLKMMGFLRYGHKNWCILENDSHSLHLFKEGDTLTQGIIQTIYPDHILITNQEKQILIPLNKTSEQKP